MADSDLLPPPLIPEPVPEPLTWHRYYWNILKIFGAESWSTWRFEMFASVVIGACAFLYAKTILGDQGAGDTLKVVMLSTASGLGIMGVWHLIRAPWLVEREKSNEKPKMKHWFFGVFGLAIFVGIVLGGTWGVVALYRHNQSINATNNRLSDENGKVKKENQRLTDENLRLASNDAGEQLKKAQQEAQAERDDARHWREAYEGVTRGDLHPDRHLDSEDQRRLREQLRRIAKEPRNKDYIKLDFGMSSQIEATQLGWQLYQIFREERWNLPSKPKFDVVPKELEAEFQAYGGAGYAQGILIFTDDPQNRGRYLAFILNDCCRLDAIVNPRSIPQNFKGTLLWIGTKQYQRYRDEH